MTLKMTLKNPYIRKREIERELEVLKVDEKHFKRNPPKNREWKRKKEYEEVEKKIFFLVIEKLIIEDCIKYFEKILGKFQDNHSSQSNVSNRMLRKVVPSQDKTANNSDSENAEGKGK